MSEYFADVIHNYNSLKHKIEVQRGDKECPHENVGNIEETHREFDVDSGGCISFTGVCSDCGAVASGKGSSYDDITWDEFGDK